MAKDLSHPSSPPRYADRRVPAEIKADPVAYSEGLAGALYTGACMEVVPGFYSRSFTLPKEIDRSSWPTARACMAGALYTGAWVEVRFEGPGEGSFGVSHCLRGT